METFNRAYTINADNRCSAISVGLCSDEVLNMLPRTLLIAAERDILRDQGLNLAERMCGKIQRIEYKGAVHLFITVPGQDTAFDRAVKDAIGFICDKDNANRVQNHQACLSVMPRCRLSYTNNK